MPAPMSSDLLAKQLQNEQLRSRTVMLQHADSKTTTPAPDTTPSADANPFPSLLEDDSSTTNNTCSLTEIEQSLFSERLGSYISYHIYSSIVQDNRHYQTELKRHLPFPQLIRISTYAFLQLLHLLLHHLVIFQNLTHLITRTPPPFPSITHAFPVNGQSSPSHSDDDVHRTKHPTSPRPDNTSANVTINPGTSSSSENIFAIQQNVESGQTAITPLPHSPSLPTTLTDTPS